MPRHLGWTFAVLWNVHQQSCQQQHYHVTQLTDIWLGNTETPGSCNRHWNLSPCCYGGGWQYLQADGACLWECKTDPKKAERLHRKHRPLVYSMGSQVLLSTSYLCIPVGKKLGPVWIGPFHMAASVGVVAYRLELPSQYKFHNGFNVSFLKGYNDSMADQVEVNLAPVVFEPGSHQELKVEHILECWYSVNNRAL